MCHVLREGWRTSFIFLVAPQLYGPAHSEKCPQNIHWAKKRKIIKTKANGSEKHGDLRA